MYFVNFKHINWAIEIHIEKKNGWINKMLYNQNNLKKIVKRTQGLQIKIICSYNCFV